MTHEPVLKYFFIQQKYCGSRTKVVLQEEISVKWGGTSGCQWSVV